MRQKHGEDEANAEKGVEPPVEQSPSSRRAVPPSGRRHDEPDDGDDQIANGWLLTCVGYPEDDSELVVA